MVIGSAMLVTACNKSGSQGPAGPAYTGTIRGHVMLFDQYGSRVVGGLSGIQVALSGNGNTTNKTAATDTNGYYIFNGVNTGSYTVNTTAPGGYGNTILPNFQFLIDTLNRDIRLSATPTFTPATFIAYQSATTANDSLVCTFGADTRLREFIVFVNNNATVNGQPSGYLLNYIKAINPNATTVSLLVPAQDLRNVGIYTGATVYFAAYSYPVNDFSVYEDYSTGKNVYNAIGGTARTATATAP
jgi:hypothetical protein